jgi:hypothetical protein
LDAVDQAGGHEVAGGTPPRSIGPGPRDSRARLASASRQLLIVSSLRRSNCRAADRAQLFDTVHRHIGSQVPGIPGE